jgi:hypothetical protein
MRVDRRCLQRDDLRVESAGENRGRLATKGLGIVVIVVSALWTLFWGTMALAVWTFGTDATGWVLLIAVLSLGVLGLVLGARLISGPAAGPGATEPAGSAQTRPSPKATEGSWH